jgi:exodeoxyribonuclease VII large subunit
MNETFSETSSRLLAEELVGDNAPALSVSELSNRLKQHVESGFGHVRLRGEISGWKRAASGHAYLKLKDQDAAIDGVIWKGVMSRVAFVPADGIEVVVTGKLTTYPARSNYQIVIESMDIAGEGALLALLEKTKQRLAAEGLFDTARKRPLPYLPKVIGVVTSPTGAVIRDILHRLADRCPTRVIVWPVLVQGTSAAGQIAAAVNGFSAMQGADRPDVVIVARGGGSIEDLWSFNDEIVVRAVANASVPIISAVGHETDTTLCDYAADMRAPTPTAAAEMAVPVRAELLSGLASLAARNLNALTRIDARSRERLTQVARRLPSPDALIGPSRQRADDLGGRLSRGLGRRLADARGELAQAGAALRPALLERQIDSQRALLLRVSDRLNPIVLKRRITTAQQSLEQVWRLAQSFHPDAPLKRGYARVEARKGGVVTSVVRAHAAGALTLYFRDGRVDVQVERGGSRGYTSPQPTQPKLL